MKILLLAEGRTGSYSIMNWLKLELNLEIIRELDECDYVNQDNVIVKRMLTNNNFILKDIKYFDKIIILYREDTLQQSESLFWATLRNEWRHSIDKKDGYYSMDDNFLTENHNEIWSIKYGLDKTIKLYKSLNFGLKISYEDIFENKIGQKVLEEYIGFTSTTTTLTLSSNKLRIYDLTQKVNSLTREINRLNEQLETKIGVIDCLSERLGIKRKLI